jgi:autotransporter-associated beta strand protein
MIGSIYGYLVLTNNISSTGNYDLTFTGESDVGVEGVIGIGSGSVIKNGTGALFLSGSNTYTGGTSLDAGGIVAMSSGAFGTGDVTIADEATLVLDGSLGDVTIANNITSVRGAVRRPLALSSAPRVIIRYRAQLHNPEIPLYMPTTTASLSAAR